MKLNWGSGIAIFYGSFVVFMIGMVVHSKSFDHSLVVDNYYEEDLKYQSHIDKVKNAQALEQDLVIREDRETKIVLLEFPENFQKLEGSVWFYRADDKSKDFTVKINPGQDGKLEIPASDIAPGRWQVKVDWQGDGTPFYKESTIFL